ncbi:MAG: putative porin [Endomicrobia bacterium]|nr:putative porin [Endomicrobiia bacterium]MCL2506105.1 putative porin [Endomicrobiia bacterium]
MRAKLAKQLQKVVLTLTAVAFMSGTAFAEVDKLATILAEKGVITFGEAQRIITETKEDVKAKTATGKNEAVPLWVQTLKVRGDLRLRTQIDSSDANNAAETHTERVRVRERFRLGIESMPLEGLKVAFGLATGAMAGTGDKNPTSANHTFEAFNKVPIFLDYAYLEYAATDWMTVSGGKVRSGAQLWMPSQLIWKSDVNPDGLAFNFKKVLNSDVTFFANAGWYALGEKRETYYGVSNNATGSSATGMPTILIAQPGIDYKYEKFSAKVGVSLQQFYLRGKYVASNETGAFGSGRWFVNTSVQPYDYSLVNPSFEFKYKEVVSRFGVSLSGDYTTNVNDDFNKAKKTYNLKDEDKNGYLICLGFGDDRIGKLGTWQFKGAYRFLGKAAIPTGFGNTDAYGAMPGKGMEYSVTTGLLQNLSGVITYYDMTNLDGKAPAQVAQFDLVYRF